LGPCVPGIATQLANTFLEDADFLAAWYSGWYNGLAKKHFAHVARAIKSARAAWRD
jgi:hypothetical protein